MSRRIIFSILASVLFFSPLLKAESQPMPASAPATLDDLIGEAYTKTSSKFANVKGRVAIMDFPSLDGKLTGLSTYIGNKVGNKLIEANIQVVDRATLDRIFAEQKMQQSALMDTSTAARIGKLAGAAIFVMGSYTDMPSKLGITLRVLSIETGQFIAASEASAPYNPDLKSEAEYLMKKPGATPTSISMDGGGNSQAAESTKNKASAFDNWVCENIRAGFSLGSVFKKALEYDEYGNEDVKQCTYMNYKDASGEDKYALRFDRWYFKTNSDCEGAASSAIKGKVIGAPITDWAYIGTAELDGNADCLQHGSEMWTDSRLTLKKKKK